MKTISKEELIDMVAAQLTVDFLAALQNSSSEKNYYSHIGSLAEILGQKTSQIDTMKDL